MQVNSPVSLFNIATLSSVNSEGIKISKIPDLAEKFSEENVLLFVKYFIHVHKEEQHITTKIGDEMIYQNT